MKMRGGFSLLEVLAVLAVVALVTGLVLASLPAHSPKQREAELVSSLLFSAAKARFQAVSSAQDLVWNHPLLDCTGQEVTVRFYADGTSDFVTICAFLENKTLEFYLDGLSGQLIQSAQY